MGGACGPPGEWRKAYGERRSRGKSAASGSLLGALRPSPFALRPTSSCLRLRASDQILELQQEFVDILELPVHGGEADIGNLVQLPEPIHDERADLRRRNLP